jgi:hypothetical protein
MIAIDNSEVFVQGDAPEEILWRGKQWAVTAAGIEALDGTYFIHKGRLLEDAEEWPWVRQMAEKNWCDLEEFATAYMVAVVLHGHSRVDASKFLRHVELAQGDR